MPNETKPDVDGFFRERIRELCEQVGRQVLEQCVTRTPVMGAKVGFVLLMCDENGPGLSWFASMGRERFIPFLRQALDKIEAARPPGSLVV